MRGIEPPISCFQNRHSTTEPHPDEKLLLLLRQLLEMLVWESKNHNTLTIPERNGLGNGKVAMFCATYAACVAVVPGVAGALSGAPSHTVGVYATCQRLRTTAAVALIPA